MSTWDSVEGVVRFPDGRLIRGAGVLRPRGDVPAPDFAVYLLRRDPLIDTWPNRWVRWRDFGLPDSADDVLAALRDARSRAEHERVEISCAGGKGRTGTAMAILAIMGGVAPGDAIEWVRANYHSKAIETRGQRKWIASAGAALIR